MVGKKIQHYEILRELGKGGMGTVYEAEDSRLGRRVAVKVLPPEAVSDTDQVGRFKREAQTASSLNHPNIVTIYDIIESDDLRCIIMEHVEGRSLREWMGDEPPVEQVIAITIQVAKALSAAHGAGIVHRDIKPDNIMIRNDGIAKILDFGLAKLVNQSRLTREGMVVGTVSHMSPEQTRGDKVGDRTDVWSLGVVLYEMLTGQPPFKADYDQAILYNILNTPARPVTGANPSVPSPLDTLVMSMLEKNPCDRPSAQEVANTLSSKDIALVTSGEPGSPPEPAQTMAGREHELRAAAVIEDRRSVAVLPFKILSGEAEYGFLRLALAEAVSHGLSSNRKLVVRPTSAVVRYAEGDVDPALVARDLNVVVVVEGSIQKLGPDVRVRVQAWDAAAGTTLLSVKLDGRMDDLFGLQDRLAEALGEAMGVGDHVRPTMQPPPRNARAYELFLRASERLLHYSQSDTNRAIEMLRSAVELDPQFGSAWARLSAGLVSMGALFDPDPKWYIEAKTAVERALALDAANPEAWSARGRMLWSPHHGFQHANALRDLYKACCLPGCSADAPIWRGIILSHIGLLDEALSALRELRESQPDDPMLSLVLGETLGWQGDASGFLEVMRETLVLDPAFRYAHLFLPIPLLYLDKLGDAESALRSAKGILGDDSMLQAGEALLWAKRGEPERTGEVLRATFDRMRSVSHVHHTYHIAATAYATIGDASRAVQVLERAVESGMPNYPAFINDPHFAPLHERPDFKKLMAKLKATWESFRAEFGENPGPTPSINPVSGP